MCGEATRSIPACAARHLELWTTPQNWRGSQPEMAREAALELAVSSVLEALPRVWAVGALARAVADALQARFNPVAVQGEVSGFSRAASGHCYFTLKDDAGQIRCAMFRRAAMLADFSPREGELVQVRGRLTVYEARGDLQLVVESISRAGQGALFEQFLRLKAQLQAEGLFEAARKRPMPALPRGIGLVTSLGAAALHDVLAALARRVPHIPVVLAPAPVQGAGAAGEIVQALSNLYRMTECGPALQADSTVDFTPIDVILLVRGGGSIEDLWAFNDEQLARAIAASPVPVITGVGHETDFTIADFVADLRAPTPTAAAELVSTPRDNLSAALELEEQRLQRALDRRLDSEAQRVDRLAARLGRPSAALAGERLRQSRLAQQMRHGAHGRLQRQAAALGGLADRMARALAPQQAREHERLARHAAHLPESLQRAMAQQRDRLARAEMQLSLLDPRLVLARGYAWLTDAAGAPVTRAADLRAGDAVQATLADGDAQMTVRSTRLR